jgi:hypothetical protein
MRQKANPQPAPNDNPRGKRKYYLLAAILAVLYVALGWSPFADLEPLYLLIVFPVGVWLIWKTRPTGEEKNDR